MKSPSSSLPLSLGLLICAVLLSSCASVEVLEPNTPTITLKTVQRRPAGLGFVVFPTGTYAPDFRTVEGVYYLAPTKLVGGGLGMSRPMRGGLFLPFPDRPDQNHAAWFDQQESSGGLLGAAVTSTTRLWRFSEPVAYTRP